MRRRNVTVGILIVLVTSGASWAEDGGRKTTWLDSLVERETLTDGWFGLGERLDERGVTVSLAATGIYQINTHGALATNRRKGRHAGSYDLEVELDLEKLFGLRGGSIHVLSEGSWSAGADPASVGSIFGINDDAAGHRGIAVTTLYYDQALFGETVRIHVGKIDVTGGFHCHGCPVAFDANTFANDETTQFMNSALVNNPTIPFPDEGLGLALYVQLAERWYVGAAVADAQANARESGLGTAFHEEDYFFSIVEAGVTPVIDSPAGPLQGAFRIGLWYDPQDKARNNGTTKRDDTGIYLSADQVITKENLDAEDTQGLSVFARLGYADHDANQVGCFWSAGAQYQGLLPTRDDDVVAFGVAQGRLTRSAGFTETHETVMEAYYNAALTGWLNVSPSIQYVINPGGVNTVKDAVIFGLRLQMAF